jgi:hypothetical protein
MPKSPGSVRRTQQSIILAKENSSSGKCADVISHHIDRQRRHVLELEKESLWLESEIRSLRLQCKDLDEQIAGLSGAEASAESVLKDIQATTDSVIFMCTAYLFSKSDVNSIVKDICGQLPVQSNPTALDPDTAFAKALAIVDLPPSSQPIQEYVKAYRSALCTVLESSESTIRLVDIREDRSSGTIHLTFGLPEELSERLSLIFEEVMNSKAHSNHSSAIRLLMRVTHTIELQTDGEPSICFSPRNNSPRKSAPSVGFEDIQSQLKPPQRSALDLPKPSAGDNSPDSGEKSSDRSAARSGRTSSDEALSNERDAEVVKQSVLDRMLELESRDIKDVERGVERGSIRSTWGIPGRATLSQEETFSQQTSTAARGWFSRSDTVEFNESATDVQREETHTDSIKPASGNTDIPGSLDQSVPEDAVPVVKETKRSSWFSRKKQTN